MDGSASLVIDRATPDDLASLLELYRHLHPNDSVSAEAPEVREAWEEILQDSRQRMFVARHEGRLVSTCTLILVPNLTHGARPYGLIENVVTHSSYRGRGFGSAVLRHALLYAWERGCYKVMLLTGRQEEETLRFYESAGFRRGIKTSFIAYPPAEAASGETSP